MKNKLIVAIVFLGVLCLAAPAVAKVDFARLAGRILIVVDKNGEAYYLPPQSKGKSAEYLWHPSGAFALMRKYGVGITNNDLTRIQVGDLNLASSYDTDRDGLSDAVELTFGTDRSNRDTDGDGYNDKEEIVSGHSPLSKDKTLIVDQAFAKKQNGRIFLQVESKGEAWYINPADSKRYYLGAPADAFEIMKKLSLGITSKDFSEMKETCVGVGTVCVSFGD